MNRNIRTLSLILVCLAAGVAFAGETGHQAALDGYCPVAYVAMNKAVKGDPDIYMEYGGEHYVFANADAKKMFEADPSKYAVAYDGYCATAISMGKKLESDPTVFSVEDGETYLFSSADAKKMFDSKPDGIIEKADEQWALLNPAFGGHCPVAYVVMNKAVDGDPAISIDYDGKHYLFANGKAKEMFEADPSKYSVAYDGYCATAMAMGKELKSDPAIFSVEEGMTFLFSSTDAKKMFDGDPQSVVKKADAQWAKLN
jgi:YHS domain-containing protein